MTERSSLTDAENGRRSTVQLVRSIAGDTAELVRKEVQLARQEVTATAASKAFGAGALLAAGVVALIGIVFLGSAAAVALERVIPDWAARLAVFGGFALVALILVAVGIALMRRPGPRLDETNRRVKEDLEWARAQLKR